MHNGSHFAIEEISKAIEVSISDVLKAFLLRDVKLFVTNLEEDPREGFPPVKISDQDKKNINFEDQTIRVSYLFTNYNVEYDEEPKCETKQIIVSFNKIWITRIDGLRYLSNFWGFYSTGFNFLYFKNELYRFEKGKHSEDIKKVIAGYATFFKEPGRKRFPKTIITGGNSRPFNETNSQLRVLYSDLFMKILFLKVKSFEGMFYLPEFNEEDRQRCVDNIMGKYFLELTQKELLRLNSKFL